MNQRCDPVAVRHCLAILDGDKEALVTLADHLAMMRHPNAGRVREIYNQEYYSAPRDESLAVLLVLPDDTCWSLACDFAEHYMKTQHQEACTPGSVHLQIIEGCRKWRSGQENRASLDALLETAPRFHQIWMRAANGREAACAALSVILAFSATGGREPAWQHQQIRNVLVEKDE